MEMSLWIVAAVRFMALVIAAEGAPNLTVMTGFQVADLAHRDY
ncbi:hypothetical protein [Hoeflea sp.]|nr:hypothetical protein [Hoeflea sp.]